MLNACSFWFFVIRVVIKITLVWVENESWLLSKPGIFVGRARSSTHPNISQQPRLSQQLQARGGVHPWMVEGVTAQSVSHLKSSQTCRDVNPIPQNGQVAAGFLFQPRDSTPDWSFNPLVWGLRTADWSNCVCFIGWNKNPHPLSTFRSQLDIPDRATTSPVG